MSVFYINGSGTQGLGGAYADTNKVLNYSGSCDLPVEFNSNASGYDFCCWEEVDNPRIGEFFFGAANLSNQTGVLAVTAGTITNGATSNPIWAALYPEFVVGNDIVFPADVGGMFLRNLGGNAAGQGVIQAAATAAPTNPFVTDTTGAHTHSLDVQSVAGVNSSPPGAGNGGVTTNTNTSSAGDHSHTITGGDAETRPVNRAYQLFTIIDSYPKLVQRRS